MSPVYGYKDAVKKQIWSRYSVPEGLLQILEGSVSLRPICQHYLCDTPHPTMWIPLMDHSLLSCVETAHQKCTLGSNKYFSNFGEHKEGNFKK